MMSLPFRVVRAMGLALACLILLAGAALAQTKYKLRSGDTLTIEVLEDASLNRTVLVLPGGSINFPLVGPVQAGGRTVDQVRQSLVAGLTANFANPPTVFVAVAGLAERKPAAPAAPAQPEEEETISAFVTGEVNGPGKLELEPGTTILQVIAQAGGLTPFAAKKRIELRRVDPASGQMQTYLFSFTGKGRGPRISGATVLTEGDVIVVPERRLFE